MCDIIQFFVIISVSGFTSSIIGKYFIQDVFMKFGIFHLVVIDDGTPFKGICIAMCDCLQVKYKMVAKRSHKGVSVEMP